MADHLRKGQENAQLFAPENGQSPGTTQNGHLAGHLFRSG